MMSVCKFNEAKDAVSNIELLNMPSASSHSTNSSPRSVFAKTSRVSSFVRYSPQAKIGAHPTLTDRPTPVIAPRQHSARPTRSPHSLAFYYNRNLLRPHALDHDLPRRRSRLRPTPLPRKTFAETSPIESLRAPFSKYFRFFRSALRLITTPATPSNTISKSSVSRPDK